MIEVIVSEYLREKLGIPVFMEEPAEKLDSYIVIEKTSGGNNNQIESATLAIQSYGKSLYEAALINEEMKKALAHITDLDDISSAKLNSDYNYTDTARKKYRYQAVFDFVYF